MAGLLSGISMVWAQRLPIHYYNMQHGLAHSWIEAIYQDKKGYLWFGTFDGLSRFDGYSFTNYGIHDGLESPIINAIVEDQQERLWVGTLGGGVARLIDDPQEKLPSGEPASGARKKFVSYQIGTSSDSNAVTSMLIDKNNMLWCVTLQGLYRAALDSIRDLKFEAILPTKEKSEDDGAFVDRHGNLWFVNADQLVQIREGRIIRYGREDAVARHSPMSVHIAEDPQGRLFVANSSELFEFIPPIDMKDRGQWKKIDLSYPPGGWGINSMIADSTGTLWVASGLKLIKYKDGQQKVYATAEGLSDDFSYVTSMAEDREGNLWVGARHSGGGVYKLSGEPILSFTWAQGIPGGFTFLVEDRTGRIYASHGTRGIMELVKDKVVVPVPDSQMAPFNRVFSRMMQDRRGDWWIGTDSGLFLFPGPELQLREGRKFNTADGISEAGIAWGPAHGSAIYEDPAGKVWFVSQDKNLYWFDPARKTRPVFQNIFLDWGPVHMRCDRSGILWLGTHAKLGRLINGKVVELHPMEGLPDVQARVFFQDSRGWFWIGLRYHGVSVTKDTAAEPLRFVNYSTRNGLVNDAVWGITEDDSGRMYFCTNKGLDRLDPSSGEIHHFSMADGLAGNMIGYCCKDRRGYIWAATSTGLSRLDPRVERRAKYPPSIYLSRIQITGEDRALPERGALRVPEITLPAARNNLRIEYVGLSFLGERRLRYQYKLEGVDKNWSPPTEERSVNYPNLASGSYRFLVRAINREDMTSPDPATLALRILPPIWQSGWFLTLAALLVGSLIYAFYRNRVARLVELERVRTRIATDLHDDIGSSLSHMAILSEVARQSISRDGSNVKDVLTQIASVSRELVDSMSDIVWAINPNKDRLSDLTQRMRRFAGEFLPGHGIEFTWRLSGVEPDLSLGADMRRQIFLIFKESLHNMVRHAGATEADIEFRMEEALLILQLRDNGRGFDPAAMYDGHGLLSMRQRASRLAGQLEIDSRAGQGTTVRLSLPLAGRPQRRWRIPYLNR